jgi:thioredoxin-like negative regulator of GroEL
MKGDLTLDYYAANNKHEYLAQTYTAYFSDKKVHPLNHKSVNTGHDLKSKDPALYAWIDTLVKKQKAYLEGDDSAFAENWAAVYVSLADKTLRTGGVESAAALIDTALIWAPDYVPALAKSIDLMRRNDNAQAAAIKLKKIVKRLGPQPAFLREAALLSSWLGTSFDALGPIHYDGKEDAHIFWLREAYAREDDFSEKAALQKALREALRDRLRWDEAIALAQDYALQLDAFSTYLRDRQREAQVFAYALKSRQADSSGLNWLDATLTQRPQDEALRLATADAHRNLGQHDKAIEILKTGLSLLRASGGKSEVFVRKIALCHALNGEAEQAKRLLGRLATSSENQEFVRTLMATGQLEAAEEAWEDLPANNECERAERAWLKVSLLEAKGERAGARKALKEAQANSLPRAWL